MGAGKTSIGKKIAKLLTMPFIDTDNVIVQKHGPIADIFSHHGEEQFRAWEHDAVRDSIRQKAVVSLGGGAVIHSETRLLLKPLPVVFLTVDETAVSRRIGGGSRPLLAGANPLESWSQIFRSRELFYREVANTVIDTSRKPMTKIAEQVVEWMKGKQ
ncbi:shikimate kinase [Microbacterium sp. YY-01]|uniref:shikimate kinase n=1 Tax=Microbacterium sp. YY-01 TaxID=3421634 RepID=UPI003D178999